MIIYIYKQPNIVVYKVIGFLDFIRIPIRPYEGWMGGEDMAKLYIPPLAYAIIVGFIVIFLLSIMSGPKETLLQIIAAFK